MRDPPGTSRLGCPLDEVGPQRRQKIARLVVVKRHRAERGRVDVHAHRPLRPRVPHPVDPGGGHLPALTGTDQKCLEGCGLHKVRVRLDQRSVHDLKGSLGAAVIVQFEVGRHLPGDQPHLVRRRVQQAGEAPRVTVFPLDALDPILLVSRHGTGTCEPCCDVGKDAQVKRLGQCAAHSPSFR